MKVVALSLALALCLIAIAFCWRARPVGRGAMAGPGTAGDATAIAAIVPSTSASVDCGSDGGACH